MLWRTPRLLALAVLLLGSTAYARHDKDAVKESSAAVQKAASSKAKRTTKASSGVAQPVPPRSLVQKLEDVVVIKNPYEERREPEEGEGYKAPEGEEAPWKLPKEGEEHAPEEEHHEGHEGEGHGEEGAEHHEKMEIEDKYLGIGVAATLIIGISFVMLIQYLTNSNDADIRRYVWEVLCCTVSIFCAVLLFQGFNAVLMSFCEGMSKGEILYVAQAHMLFWCFVLHWTLAYHPGRKGQAVLLAHITGFAAINAWGGVQQFAWFGQSAMHASLVVPISLFGIMVMIRICDIIIEHYAAWTKNPCPKHGHESSAEAAEEAENDIISFCLSFQTCQAVRLWITGVMPNAEGEEKEGVVWTHSFVDTTELGMMGLLFLALTIVVFFEEDILFAKPPKRVSEAPRQSLASAALPGMKVRGDEKAVDRDGDEKLVLTEEGEKAEDEEAEDEEDEDEEDEEEEEDNPLSLQRIMDCAICYLTMCFAFIMFFTGEWAVAHVIVATLPTRDETILGLGLAMVMSIFSFAGIYALDFVDDTTGRGNPRLHRIIGKVVSALAVLVGFSWERCFDGAIDVLSKTTVDPAIAKMALAAICAALLVPAWRMHMLPMVIHEGWKFGFVVHGHWDLNKIDRCRQYLVKAHKEKVEHEKYKAEHPDEEFSD